jgi:kynureninase
LDTAKILALIDEHAEETALLLLPGLQYYTGQLLDMPKITTYARSRGITVGWDLAHAAGNVPLALHDWDVDFAVWCNYKYLNAGPGAIAGAFVHERHGQVLFEDDNVLYRKRLEGWYGGDKKVRFEMKKQFIPTPGAQGYQVSNPSAVDLASLSASLEVFGMTTMEKLREKSLLLTAYAEWLLHDMLVELQDEAGVEKQPPFRIITPSNPLERGAQLSLLLRPGLLEKVSEALKEGGVVCDQRKPDVVRIAPVPMYSTFTEVWQFMEIFRSALKGDSK